MRCVNCDGELIAGKRFCPACGTEVVARCPGCNAEIKPGFHFCPDCGAPLAAPAAGDTPTLDDHVSRLASQMPPTLAQKIQASRKGPTEERKLVTVLFCDLVGSTAIAERLDPEEYRDLLERYMALAYREIYQVEGIVNHLGGDGLMALFGAPVAHEDAPQRAIRAALAIRDALAELDREIGERQDVALEVRIGIHTGPVVVGTVGSDAKMDYTAIGDTTNLASRLQTAARPGTILISEATERLVRGAFHLEPAGPFQVKGKREPVTAHEVLAPTDAVTPMAIAEARGMTPLVGRNAELTQLCTCYDRVAESLSQVVEIIGDAGSGKSRLVYEFKQRMAADPVGAAGAAVFFEARCSALTQAVPYAPWIGMIRQHFALLPGEDAASARAKIADGVRAIDPDLDTIFPYLAHLLSLPGDDCGCVPSDELKPQTFAAIGKLIHATSLRVPVVIVVEDLHWIDDESRAMLDLAVGKMHDERTMLVVTHRPDYHPFWRSPAAFTQLSLRPLAADDATAIIRSVVGGRLPAKLEQKVLARADGNPFFLEEITRALIEGGALLRGDGHIRLTRPIAQIGIPDTVQELIAARLDRLGPDAKRVAQVAAVLGRQFHRTQLAHLLAPEGIDVTRALETLESRGVIHRKNVLSPDEYRFGESLAQEVAYEALLLKERRQLHERIGFLLEGEGSEGDAERAALLAHHFARSDNWEKAIAALLHAAQRAEALPSYTTAVNLYRQAWALADATLNAHPDDDRVQRWAMDAGFGLARVAVLYGPSHLGEAEAAGRRGRELAAKLGALDTLAGLCTFHGLIIMNGARERFAEGLAVAEEGLAVAQRAQLETSVISISRGLAWAYLIDGQFELAHRTIAWVMQDLERLGHRAQLSDLFFGCRWVQSGIRYHSDELDAAHAQAVEDYELAIKAKNRTSQGGASAVLAEIAFDRGEYAEAVRFAERSLEIAHAISSLAGVRTSAAIALAARIELGESGFETPYVESIEEGLAQGGTLPVNSRLVTDALLAAGELERARRIAELAYARGGGRLREALAAASLGDVMLRLGPNHWGEAERWYHQAIGVAQAIGARSAHAAALLGAGELAAARGEREPAERQLRQALAICAELGLNRLHARGERALADLSADVPQQA